jgi:hypothetical protein
VDYSINLPVFPRHHAPAQPASRHRQLDTYAEFYRSLW